MKIVISGGSGQVGRLLARRMYADKHEVVVLSRKRAETLWRTVDWDARTLGDWRQELEGADAVINLTGRSVNCRYNAANRQAILDSRVHSTRIIGAAIAGAQCPPRVWLQASTATIYSHRYDAPNDEKTGLLGGTEPNAPDTWGFSIDVARAWERALEEAQTPQTRKVALRSAMTMTADREGIFDTVLRLVRFGLGGQAGNGRQYVSWIHGEDFIRAIYWLIEHDSVAGPVNLSAPHPLPNAEFMRAIRQAWGISFGLPTPKWMLEIGAVFLKTETELILKSRRVVPNRLLEAGFPFQFPTWPEAAQDLCRQWREQNRASRVPGSREPGQPWLRR
ncbi:MAG: Epimerase family protein [Chthonomonadaceae bacterium]|nr:Epimerase family protein [Chthonomonadaceae bacterium]